jgi:hypothetical protein
LEIDSRLIDGRGFIFVVFLNGGNFRRRAPKSRGGRSDSRCRSSLSGCGTIIPSFLGITFIVSGSVGDGISAVLKEGTVRHPMIGSSAVSAEGALEAAKECMLLIFCEPGVTHPVLQTLVEMRFGDGGRGGTTTGRR